MEFVKAKEVLEAITGLDNNSKESILGALKVAEHIESASMDFYVKEKEKTKGTEMESFFAFMVKEEEMHLAKIVELKKVVSASSTVPVLFKANKVPEIHALPAGDTEMASVLFALEREKKAAQFYSDAAEKTSGNVKAFFEELTAFEKEHVRLLEELSDNSQNTNELIMG